jgi:peptide/nickel transport system ATP-binding protein
VSLLQVEGLTVHYLSARGEVHAVDEVSFKMQQGEALGLVGESGCGKTTVAMAIMQLLPPNATILGGRLIFRGNDLLTMNEEAMRHVRWKEISMIFQAAMNALNPVHRIGDQIIEAILTHDGDVSPERAQDRVDELFAMVGLDPARMRDYPHQYSGGMKQRAIIAMALACKPSLILADEPTTALDVVVQDQILGEMRALQKEMGLSLLYISHDISTIIRSCDQVGVMYAGQLVEFGPVDDVLASPLHPYTQGLMASYPKIKGPKERLCPIPGELPNLLDPPGGCRFCPRCPDGGEVCPHERPTMREYREGHLALCHRVSV